MNLPNDPDWVFTYDTDFSKNQKGRLAQASNGMVTSAYSYTDRGQVWLERTTLEGLVFDTTTTYDAAGQVATLTSPGGISTTTQYAGARPKRVEVTAGSATQSIENLAFYPFGPRARAELPPYDAATPAGNKVISTRSYNLRGQVSEIDVTGPGSLVILDRSYTYDFTSGAPGPVDPAPNLDRVIDHRDGSESRFYFYDGLDRLGKASDLSGTALFTYLYDAAGNRISQSNASGTTAYGYVSSTDRLASSTGASAQSYQHDAFGSRTYAGATAYAGIPTYVYDDADRLATLQSATTPPVTLDPVPLRRLRTTGGQDPSHGRGLLLLRRRGSASRRSHAPQRRYRPRAALRLRRRRASRAHARPSAPAVGGGGPCARDHGLARQ